MQGQLQAEGQDLQLFRDECLGTGAYGKVCKAKLNELPCAAKLLHMILFEPQNPIVQQRFERECELLQMVKHPNVVQYLGIARDPQSGLPILLMELLDENLTNFLEHSEEPLPHHLQVNLWYDVALALTYLHSKHIVHRDLSGNNVLLIAGNRAKVSDFGMSTLTDVDVTKSRLTHCPGNANYMSPEAMIEPPVYCEKLDVFSSGVVAIQIITQQFPDPTASMMRRDDPQSPTGFSLTPISEIERRRNHIGLIDPQHPMLPVIQSCLSDRERDRPSARQLCHHLVTLKQAPEYLQSKQQPTPQEKRIREREQKTVQQMQTEIAAMEREMQELQQKNEEHKRQVSEHQQAVYEQQHQNHNQQQQIQEQQHANKWMQIQITKSERDMQALKTQLCEKSQELQLKKQELWRTQYNLQQKTEELQQQKAEFQQKAKEFQQKTEEVQAQLKRALQGQGMQEIQIKITELESKLKENHDQGRLMEQLPSGT